MVDAAAQRLFFALWPEPDTARVIWKAAAQLVPNGVGRRLAPEHIHLTLAFLGSINDAQQQCMRQAAAGLQSPVFTLTLDTAGHFPRPQVVWMGTNHVPPELLVFQNKLVNKLKGECGYQPEQRPFMPHLTVWRKVKRAPLPESLPPVAWPISRFVLACSRTLSTGAEYSIVQAWPLSG